MAVVRFSNETAKSLELIVEPWVTKVTVPPGSKFAVHYPTSEDQPDTSCVEIHEGTVRFWCEGDTFEVELDGKIIVT